MDAEAAQELGPSGGRPPLPVLVTVEGNIGAGKSTLLKAIAERGKELGEELGIELFVVQEPVDRWCAPVLGGDATEGSERRSLLETYYADRRGTALAFQMYAMLTRVQQLADLTAELTSPGRPSPPGRRTVVVSERCSWSDYELFGRPMRDSGLLSEADWFTYSAWFEAVTVGRLAPALRPSGVAYLRCEPDVCAARIAARARHGEVGIDAAYLELLHGAHETYVAKATADARLDLGVLAIDGNANGPEAIRAAAERILRWAAGSV